MPTHTPAEIGGSKPKIPKIAKIILIVIGALLLLSALGFGGYKAFSSFTAGVKLVEYTSSENNYSISYPEGWEIDTDGPSSEVSFKEPAAEDTEAENAKYRAEMSVAKIEYNSETSSIGNKDEYFVKLEESLGSLFDKPSYWKEGDEYAEVASSEKIKVGEYDALNIKAKIFNYEGNDGENASGYITAIYIDEENTVIFTISGHESDSKYVDKHSSIADSFSYKKSE